VKGEGMMFACNTNAIRYLMLLFVKLKHKNMSGLRIYIVPAV